MTGSPAPAGPPRPTRPPGRPRSATADRAIIDATLEAIADDGVGALSVESVAARAGVGKATIYRRFPSREALLAAAMSAMHDDLPAPAPAGGVQERLVALLEGVRTRSRQTPAGRASASMLGAAHTHPELFACFYRQVIDARRERFRAVLRDAVASGEIASDTDIELTTTLLVAPMLYLVLLRPQTQLPPEAETSRRIVEQVLCRLLR